jgi:hypothetical protein
MTDPGLPRWVIATIVVACLAGVVYAVLVYPHLIFGAATS